MSRNMPKLAISGRQFLTTSKKNVQIWDHFFPLLFPKDSESLKILDIRLREVGAKRPLNGTSKVNRQTEGQTDGQTDGRTFRLIESIGPEGRCFENWTKGWKYSVKAYYPVVPAVVGTTSSSDIAGLEASGGCCWQDGLSCFWHICWCISHLLQCKCPSTMYLFINRLISTGWYQHSDINIVKLTEWHHSIDINLVK